MKKTLIILFLALSIVSQGQTFSSLLKDRTTKLYDRIMFELAELGWMMKIICGIIGVCFLLGID